MNQVFNHLWQSTVFAAAVAAACMALRRSSPRLRYSLWLAASLKFLVPFSLLVSMGARIEVRPDTPSLRAMTVQEISTYFAPVAVIPSAVTARETFDWPTVLGAIWLIGTLFLLLRWIGRWRRIRLAAHSATRLPFANNLPVFSSSMTMEPGVFGIFRPVILLPSGLSQHLTPEQMRTILVHEVRHIRCRDNLTAALHMCIEMLFWFHPVVWWIGARLIDERERDCDEAVLRLGSSPGDYARSILHVCETYVNLPLACASGISGADLKNRIREIMTWRGSAPTTFWAKVALAAVGVVALSAPFLIGVVRAQTLPSPPAYGYEVASIHASAPGETRRLFGLGPQGGLRIINNSVLELLADAYHVKTYQIFGLPKWAESSHYDIVLTPAEKEASLGTDPTPTAFLESQSRNQQRLQAVMRDRFGLILRAETRELPIYSLIQAKDGAKLSAHPADAPRQLLLNRNGPGHLVGVDVPLRQLASALSFDMGRPVVDETGLPGDYDFKLDWTPQLEPSAAASDGPSIFTALTQQLGLRLESKKGPVPVYVIEKIERPTEN